MSWRDEIIRHAQHLGRDVYESEIGVGIEFEDQCDAFWILPDSTRSDIALADTEPGTIQEAMELFDRTDTLRSQVLHILSHHWAKQFNEIDRSRDGSWTCSCAGFSVAYEVGRNLTKIAIECNSIVAVFDRWEEFGFFDSNKPQSGNIAEWLEQTPPSWIFELGDEDDEPVYKVPGAVAAVKLQKNISDKRMLALLDELALLLPEASASFNFCNPNHLEIDYDDRHDCMRVRWKSAKLKRRLTNESPTAIAVDIAAKFKSKSRLRMRAINAMIAASDVLRLRIDSHEANSPLGSRSFFWFGKTTKQFGCSVGRELSLTLNRNEPQRAFQKLFPDSPKFAAECDRQFAAVDQLHMAKFTDTPLAPDTYTQDVQLLELDAATISQIDKYADEHLEKVFEHKNIFGEYYYSRWAFDSTVDDWGSRERWIAIAKLQASNKRGSLTGILALLELGDPTGKQLAAQKVQEFQPHFEGSEEEFEIAWHMRKEFPDAYEKWLAAEFVDDCFGETLAKLGDPIAKRQQQFDCVSVDLSPQNTWEQYDVTLLSVQCMDETGQDYIRRALKKWLTTEFRFAVIDKEQFLIAAEMNWPEVYDAIENNPFVLASLLENFDCGASDFDGPALLMNTDIPLIWSLGGPSVFLARVIATAFETDFVGLAKAAAKASAKKRPSEKDGLGYAYQAYERYHKELLVHLAISWKRCRHLLD